MAIFSCLKPINRLQLIKNTLITNVRNSGHGKQFPMRSGVFHWRKFKDSVHLFTMLGAIPLVIMTTYVNIVVGPAELAEIPEGYEPHHWEYYKSPISRFMAKHLIRDKRQDYECMVQWFNEESERFIMRNIESQVKEFMSIRSDYKSWYYRPIDAYLQRVDREEKKRERDQYAGQYPYIKDETHFIDGAIPNDFPDE